LREETTKITNKHSSVIARSLRRGNPDGNLTIGAWIASLHSQRRVFWIPSEL